MSQVRFICDEDVPEQLLACASSLEPAVVIGKVGQPGFPAKGTKDPQLLLIAESMEFALISRDKKTMHDHIANHLAAGHHTWGTFFLRPRKRIQDIA